jgi:hypothetical protein
VGAEKVVLPKLFDLSYDEETRRLNLRMNICFRCGALIGIDPSWGEIHGQWHEERGEVALVPRPHEGIALP